MKVKIKVNLVRAILLALGLPVAGCASHPQGKIVFSDDAEIRAAARAAVQPRPAELEKADELKIERAVFSYLLEQHFWNLVDYSAVFLQADDAQVTAMMKKYPDHAPPIKPSRHALIRSHRTPLDKDTKKPALVLSAEISEPNSDGSVDAVGRWYAGDSVTGFRAFHLTRTGDDWDIAEVK